jgi:hypothetical protein
LNETSAIVVPDLATCLDCKYPLRNLQSLTCPECGRPFDPTDAWTMRVPTLPDTWGRRILQRSRWHHRRLRVILIGLAIASGWFPAPNPVPTLAICFLWLGYALPYLVRTWARKHLIKRYGLSTAFERVDDPGLRRLRRAFIPVFLIIAAQIPFLLALAVSYPCLSRTAHHWWAEVPVTEEPPAKATVCGLFYVQSIDVGISRVDFNLPTGRIVFAHDQDEPGLSIRWLPQ